MFRYKKFLIETIIHVKVLVFYLVKWFCEFVYSPQATAAKLWSLSYTIIFLRYSYTIISVRWTRF